MARFLTPFTSSDGFYTIGNIDATGNVVTNNITASGIVSVTGNIQANANVSVNANVSANNITITNAVTVATLNVSNLANLAVANTQVFSLGIGTAASGVLGEIRAANNITAFYSSDSKFKENVVDISSALEKVVAIGGKLFDWKDDYIADRGGLDDYFLQKHDVGVIAQDVQRVLPEAVRERPDGSLAVDYPKLSALAFAAIKELSEQVSELHKEIEQLKGK